jgi:hypothetical protein
MGRGAARAAPLPDLGLQMPLGAGLRVLLEREASIAVVDEAASGDEARGCRCDAAGGVGDRRSSEQ